MKHLSNYLTVALFLLPSLAMGFNTSFTAPADSTQKPLERGHKVNGNEGIRINGYQVRTIVIDAGHGGKDPGCSGVNHSREKHLALAISLKVADLIRSRYPQVKVILTRDKDVFVPLYERAAIANRAKADLFLSIHCNFMPKLSWVRGSETYVMGLHTAEHNLDVAKRENAAILFEADYEKNYDYDPNSPEGHIMLSMVQNAFLDQSILFAQFVEQQIHSHAGRRSRGVKQAGFVVLKETMMPSVLVETGFLSNAGEEQYLNTEPGQMAMAEAIVKAFGQYKGEVEEAPQAIAYQPPPSPNPNPGMAQRPAAGVPPVETKQVNPVPSASLSEQKKAEPYQGSYQFTPAMSDPYKGFNPTVESTTTSPQARSASPESYSSQPDPIYVNQPLPVEIKDRQPTALASFREDQPVHFRIQLAASAEPLPAGENPFTRVGKPVEVITEDGLYKYQVLQIKSYREGTEMVKLLRMKGFIDAFLVAYQEGKRVELQEELFLEK